ncbi:MAG: hypothetical protein Ct9H90mP7_3550 [Candidatus Neomarinimicrobiota bacterium]|nr:MAG: hypothetical protein Ct9H90mP7_3550 [Candidatus Neomarinimicrobiota bacterium]
MNCQIKLYSDKNEKFTGKNSTHIPVMTGEVLKYLNPNPDGIYIDGTIGGGGHLK